jgi:hypothetical protein
MIPPVLIHCGDVGSTARLLHYYFISSSNVSTGSSSPTLALRRFGEGRRLSRRLVGRYDRAKEHSRETGKSK